MIPASGRGVSNGPVAWESPRGIRHGDAAGGRRRVGGPGPRPGQAPASAGHRPHRRPQAGDPEPVRLEIPALGAPTVLTLEGPDGKPVIDREVVVQSLPAGPLSDRLRPASLRTDGHSKVLLCGLPAGENVLRIRGAPIIRA